MKSEVTQNSAPTIDSLAITWSDTDDDGNVDVSELASRSNDVFVDVDGDFEDFIDYEWYRSTSSNCSDKIDLDEGDDDYVPVSADVGKFLVLGATPFADSGVTEGPEAFSNCIGPVESD